MLSTIFYLFFRLIAKAESERKIHGAKITRESPAIAHLMYTDDLVIFYQANEEEAGVVIECINKFTLWSGQLVDLDKSVIDFSKNVESDMKIKIMNMMTMKEYDHHNKYLGLPFCKSSSKKKAFQSVVEKLSKKLQCWKPKALTQARRGVLIKFVA